MLKFALAAFVPSYFAGWAIAEPGPLRGAGGLGAGLGFIGIGLLANYVATQSNSRRPAIWGAAAMSASIGLALLGHFK